MGCVVWAAGHSSCAEGQVHSRSDMGAAQQWHGRVAQVELYAQLQSGRTSFCGTLSIALMCLGNNAQPFWQWSLTRSNRSQANCLSVPAAPDGCLHDRGRALVSSGGSWPTITMTCVWQQLICCTSCMAVVVHSLK